VNTLPREHHQVTATSNTGAQILFRLLKTIPPKAAQGTIPTFNEVLEASSLVMEKNRQAMLDLAVRQHVESGKLKEDKAGNEPLRDNKSPQIALKRGK